MGQIKSQTYMFFVIASLLILVLLYSIVVCNKTQVKSPKDEAILILDSFYVLFENYKDRNDNKLGPNLEPGLHPGQFQQILEMKNEYLLGSTIFSDEDIFLKEIDSNAGTYEITIKYTDQFVLSITESGVINELDLE